MKKSANIHAKSNAIIAGLLESNKPAKIIFVLKRNADGGTYLVRRELKA